MADETMMSETTAATKAPAVAPGEKKTRKPRTPKAAAETAAVEISAAPTEAPVKKTRAKRGSKISVAKAEKDVAKPKRIVARKPRAKASVAQTGSSVDFIDDLIKLEEENKQLRKELSAKLRSENADLRKRLGKS